MATRDELRLAFMCRAYEWIDAVPDDEVAQATSIDVRFRCYGTQPSYPLLFGDTDTFGLIPPETTRLLDMRALINAQLGESVPEPPLEPPSSVWSRPRCRCSR